MQKSNLVSILRVNSKIEDFEFDEKKFLNGLTEEEFNNITSKIDSRAKYEKQRKKYKEIIEELVKQQDNNINNPSYLGVKEDVIFYIRALFIEYTPKIKDFLEENYWELPSFGKWGLDRLKPLSLEQGETKITTPTSDINGTRGNVLIEDINKYSLNDPKILEALFRSVNHSEEIAPMRRSIAYGIITELNEIGESSLEKKTPLYITLQENQKIYKGQINLIKLSFPVNGTIQYRFTPCFDSRFGLEKFSLSDSVYHVNDINKME